MAFKVLLLVKIVFITIATTQAMSLYAPIHDHYNPVDLHTASPLYSFGYALKDDYTGNDFGHQETRDGYNTIGHYYVNLPGGSYQKVSYNVGGNSGVLPQVTYLKDQVPVYVPSTVNYVQ
ncbi:pro-resilin-like [Palaemon carinicauda]|uniref:pro-resilin-like n=1 Tax=Palaemon carinicauda TaxID=392227 RepID=UPI0035B5E57D